MLQVVPREYQSTEHHHNSLRHRKRSALSLADPVEMLKTRGIHSLEESSELTRCLTPEEIVNLNQGRPSGSPSDRARLFSFTKNLRNPFSKSRGKREKDTRDRLISPDKEQQVQWHGLQEAQQQAHQRHHHQGRGTPPTRHHHKHGSPVPGWSSHGSERTEGVCPYICMFVDKKIESYFSDRRNFSNIRSRTSRRTYRLV